MTWERPDVDLSHSGDGIRSPAPRDAIRLLRLNLNGTSLDRGPVLLRMIPRLSDQRILADSHAMTYKFPSKLQLSQSSWISDDRPRRSLLLRSLRCINVLGSGWSTECVQINYSFRHIFGSAEVGCLNWWRNRLLEFSKREVHMYWKNTFNSFYNWTIRQRESTQRYITDGRSMNGRPVVLRRVLSTPLANIIEFKNHCVWHSSVQLRVALHRERGFSSGTRKLSASTLVDEVAGSQVSTGNSVLTDRARRKGKSSGMVHWNMITDQIRFNWDTD
ncbi:hypothetical protein B0H13DRAFT_1891768 [Mycena leptocephala]|nr:hypothetical protein B0H13DRAFT_1891768 [Mycena leptocephala]